MLAIEVHTHILSREFADLLTEQGGPMNEVRVDKSGDPAIHPVGDMDGCLARINALPDEVREAVRHENAARIFGLS